MSLKIEECFVIHDRPHHLIAEGRYWCSNGFNLAIVATVTDFGNGQGDWAAYIGASSDEVYRTEEGALIQAARYGAKLDEGDARYFFDVPLPYRD